MADSKNKEVDEKLREIKEEVVNCKKCSLYKNRNLPVVGEGSHDADIVFIGEAPGKNEDQTGRPLCGRAGSILDKLLDSIDLKRENVYICNILKCKPPGNRDPQKGEIRSCTPYLQRQLKAISPTIISPLGKYAMEFLMNKCGLEEEVKGISKIHGKIYETKAFILDAKLIPLYHPAVATYNPNMMDTLKEDFQILKEVIEE